MPFRCRVRMAVAVAGAVLLAQPAFCQAKPSGGGTTTPGSTGTTSTGTAGTPGTLGNTPSTGATSTPSTTLRAPVFISGRVMMEDGTPPPESVSIERACLQTTRTEGYTDNQGYFSIQLGDEQGVFQDASEDTGQSMRSMTGGSSGSSGSSAMATAAGSDRRFQNCDIRAKLAGYRSQSISLTGHRTMDNPDIGTILLHREGKDEGTTVSMVSLLAPKDAKKAFEKGLAAEKKNNPTEAEKEFQQAVDLYPKYSAAWTELGKIQASRNELVDARRSFDQAIQGDPKFLGPFLQISLLAMQARKWEELADVTDRAMRLDPFEYPMLYLFNAVAYYNLKKFDASQQSIQAAAKLDTLQQLPQISHLQGLLLLQRHDYPAAAERLRNYLKLAPDGEDAAAVRTQLAQVDRVISQNAAAPSGPKQ